MFRSKAVKISSFLFFVFTILYTLTPIPCFSAVPSEMNIMMRLRQYGQPYNGTRQMQFTVYDAITGGNQKWTSGLLTVNVSSGALSYKLAPECDWRGKDFWLETVIEGKIMKPRQKLTSQVFAYHSRTAENIEADSSIRFVIGASTVAYIDTNGNVGIGTTVPGTKLEVNGGIRVAGPGIFEGTVSASTPTVSNHLATKAYVDSTVVSLGAWTTNSGNVYRSSGNVGIGTTNPQSALEVNGTVTISSPTASSHAATKGYVDARVGGSIGTGTSGQTVRNDNGGWVATSLIYNDGNRVGIGTVNPQYGLEVSSSGKFSGTVTVSTPTAYDHAATKGYVDASVGNSTSWSGSGDVYRNTGNVGIGTASPAEKLEVAGNIKLTGTVDDVDISTRAVQWDRAYNVVTSSRASWDIAYGWGNHANAGYAVPNTTMSGLIKSTGTGNSYFMGGNVGVGTTDPQAALHINSDNTSADGIWNVKILDTKSFDVGVGGGISFWGKYDSDANTVAGAGIKSIKSNATNLNRTFDLGFYTREHGQNLTEKVRITGAGHTIFQSGITASSGTFNGTVTASTPTAWNHAATKGYVDQALIAGGSWLVSSPHLYFNTGNVGIGTVSPVEKLEVLGNGKFSGTVLVSTPTVFDHAATKGYVDAALTGQGSWIGGGANPLYYQASNVGIGTASPASRLEVQGAGDNMLTLTANDSNQNYIKFTNSTTGSGKYTDGFLIGLDADESVAVWNYEATPIRIAVNGSEALRIKPDGNVGIGTTSPGTKLEISGVTNVANKGIVYVDNSNNGHSYITINSIYAAEAGLSISKSGTQRWWIYQPTNYDDLRINSETGNCLTIQKAGSVGIGTTSPGSKLHVSGSGSVVSVGNFGTELKLENAATVSGTGSGSGIASNGSGLDLGAWSQPITFSFAGSEKVRIKPDGNVGIGTTSPAGKLQVVESGSYSAVGGTVASFVRNGSSNSGCMIAVISGNSSGFSSLDLGDVDNQGAGRVLYDNGDNYMRLDTNGSEKVRIKSDGNVGIGTTNPGNNLQISSLAGVQTTPNQISIGSSFTGDNPAGVNYKLKIYDAGGNSVNGITSTTSGMTYGVIAGGDHIFMGGNAGNSGTERMRITAGGSVGIGTASPGAKLDINGSAKVMQVGQAGSGNDNYLRVIGDANNYDMGVRASSAGGFWFLSDTTDYRMVLKNGSVGIGTVSPSHTLTITNSGTGDFNDVFSVLTPNVANGSHSGAVLFGQADSSRKSAHVSFVGNATAGQEHMAFGIWGADDLMVLKGNGNLGIGTASPGTKLEVNGTVSATAFSGNGANLSGMSASQVGLGNVTNESKTTMFTNPTFSGTVTAGNVSASGNITSNGQYVTVSQVGNDIIQRGKTAKSQASLTVTFPVQFSSVPNVVVSPHWEGSGNGVAYIETIQSVTTSNFVVLSGNVGADYYIEWIAIGSR